LTADHLGSPRIITDSLGKVIARHDYSAFGDESFTVQRTQSLNYKPDTIRQDYTGYQKDEESGLEFAQARYYNSAHGRFTSVDPLTASANVKDPQTFNRYSYAMNSPYKFTDPLGLISESTGACGTRCANSGDWVDGSAFRGRDATYDWANFAQASARDTPAQQVINASQNQQGTSISGGSSAAGEPGQTATASASVSNQESAPSSTSNFVNADYNGAFIVAWGEPGTVHNVGQNFERAARTAGAELEKAGYQVLYFAITGIYGFQGLLDTAAKFNDGKLGVNIALFTHGGWDSIHLGDGSPDNNNRVWLGNVNKLVNRATNLSSVFLYACFTGANSNGIAAKLATQLNVPVHASTGGMIFSTNPTKPTGVTIHPSTGPTYMVNSGGKMVRFSP
jgi:RHS repeat-associated protein